MERAGTEGGWGGAKQRASTHSQGTSRPDAAVKMTLSACHDALFTGSYLNMTECQGQPLTLTFAVKKRSIYGTEYIRQHCRPASTYCRYRRPREGSSFVFHAGSLCCAKSLYARCPCVSVSPSSGIRMIATAVRFNEDRQQRWRRRPTLSLWTWTRA